LGSSQGFFATEDATDFKILKKRWFILKERID
jgi:hypothetical protein